MTKKIAFLVVGSCVFWLIHQTRDILYWILLMISSYFVNIPETPFPLGQKHIAKIETPTSFFEKPYIVSLKTEFHSASNWRDLKKELNYPREISLKVYKKTWGGGYEKINETFISRWEADGKLINSSKFGREAFMQYIYYESLPAGKYLFEVSDHSTPNEIYEKIETSINVFIPVEIK